MGRPSSEIAPILIGRTVTAVIGVLAPLTEAGLNPAWDFGPRLFVYLAGWGVCLCRVPLAASLRFMFSALSRDGFYPHCFSSGSSRPLGDKDSNVCMRGSPPDFRKSSKYTRRADAERRKRAHLGQHQGVGFRYNGSLRRILAAGKGSSAGGAAIPCRPGCRWEARRIFGSWEGKSGRCHTDDNCRRP